MYSIVVNIQCWIGTRPGLNLLGVTDFLMCSLEKIFIGIKSLNFFLKKCFLFYINKNLIKIKWIFFITYLFVLILVILNYDICTLYIVYNINMISFFIHWRMQVLEWFDQNQLIGKRNFHMTVRKNSSFHR